ncbi:malto-oligosyltrehalose trehalohydrolase [Geobacter sp. AOG2]|uniref:malto-oligosyltrehalose trehalohydrolase n=1 Tax=Geobacter sp. AOG2 TaxID=1566347 RepID=UPI001CC442A3|nr:malto-oligosyltrehalose trehalohydrolase [Geobacter sp. AOG2]GFE60699.1 malto-oligosyltrehalose trehalohydrolase [Geobacter sp. AOG2]
MADRERASIGTKSAWQLDLGATPLPDGSTRFRVWAPRARKIAVAMPGRGRASVPLSSEGNGYFSGIVADTVEGDLYRYLLDDTIERPDPASRFQPEGVHGPSQVVAPDRYQWHDREWCGIPQEQYVMYELHVGVFSPDGTFGGIIPRLDYLCDLGITALELMPVAQFPGSRNWGYDGTFSFAPQNSYGGPLELKRLVDACHVRGLAVILDVVYNHLGPEGNYLHAFAPYFTDRYHTPWGDAINFDGPDSDPVRHHFISNALYWVSEYHIDALRLDAIHGIYDFSARHILQELTEAVHCQAAALGRRVHVIAESDLNDVRVITPPAQGGFGLDAQWNDDFHHALRALLTGDRNGYYADFGPFSCLVKAYREGFVLNGTYSTFRRRHHGSSCADRPPSQLVVCAQNHDQVGNRMRGERLQEYLTLAQLKLAAATVLLSPYLPLLFMGEEYAEPARFPYFVSHDDADLVEAVRMGRQREFAAFNQPGEIPDPQAEETFLAARLNPALHRQGDHADLFGFYRHLIQLRKDLAPLARLDRNSMEIVEYGEQQVLAVRRSYHGDQVLCLLNFSAERQNVHLPGKQPAWRIALDSTTSADAHTPRIRIDNADDTVIISLAPYAVLVCRKE